MSKIITLWNMKLLNFILKWKYFPKHIWKFSPVFQAYKINSNSLNSDRLSEPKNSAH